MLDDLDVIHMNGRLYDPDSGRFTSADPFIQSPDATQNYDRYGYVLNNPLTATDPSGWNSAYMDNRMKYDDGIVLTTVPVHGSRIVGLGIAMGNMGAAYALLDSIERRGDLEEGENNPPLEDVTVSAPSIRPERTPPPPRIVMLPVGTSNSEPQGNQQPTNCPKDSASSGYWTRAGRNWVDTNQGVPGLLAPAGLGLLTAGKTSEAWLGTRAATFGRWAFSGFRPIQVGPAVFTTAESGVLVGASAILNFAYTGLSFEAGVLGGSMISAIPNTSGGSVRDSLATGLYDLLGPDSNATEVACGW
jgi:RHS repeat-associated protein